ncbi:MAG: DMT family protein [Planctomycetales bacterium]|nr:DMT family protein [Planctomycetales bacterium]
MTLLKTTALLVASNFFMLSAWYLHPRLRFLEGRTIALAVLVSWGIAFFEYLLQVPANRIGYAGGISFYQLKFLQEIITLAVFVPFALLFLNEKLTWNYVWAAICLCGAAYFVFSGGFKPANHAKPQSTTHVAPPVPSDRPS